ncbi:nuclear transport factor 2 family protein [Candidatus Thorarchaeota archaeon]|nr:MAG: nuclear transport factor 2 family protein [Candidatus Thorarchaeota archaeon]
MTQRDPKLTALLFNERINSLDLEGLVGFMTDDHTFIDSTEEAHVGKEKMKEGREDFFSKHPD